MSLRGFVRACHPLPAAAVTVVMSAYGVALGWRGASLLLLVVTLLIGQLSVGWSNDAFDARADAIAGRLAKPTVSGLASARALWVAASIAVVVAAGLSWWVAGWRGGSFHVLALAMAWLYNTVLSRTPWSWLPYAVAFGSMPAFLSLGLDGAAPPAWSVAVFAIVGVSAHLANALPDIDSDRAAGLDGLAVRLGPRRSIVLCWSLLAIGTVILALVLRTDNAAASLVVVVAYVGAVLAATLLRRRSAVFGALLAVVGVDVVALIVAGSQVG